jgi:hypothetical protein
MVDIYLLACRQDPWMRQAELANSYPHDTTCKRS